MYESLADYIKQLEASTAYADRAKEMRKLLKRYPHLSLYRDRDEKLLLCSFDVNFDVTGVDFRFINNDPQAPIEAMCFKEDGNEYIYSEPISVVIGYKNDKGFGIVPAPEWRQLSEEAGWPRDIIRTIKDYLDRNPEISYL